MGQSPWNDKNVIKYFPTKGRLTHKCHHHLELEVEDVFSSDHVLMIFIYFILLSNYLLFIYLETGGQCQNEIMFSYHHPCRQDDWANQSHPLVVRATSHTRLRARDHYTSSTLIGGKGGACPSSLHTNAWGTNGVCECKMDVESAWVPTWHRTDHVSWSLGLFSNTTSCE